MRKLLYSAMTLVAATVIATPALAGHRSYDYPAHTVAPVAGVVSGTVLGLGTSEGWWGSTVAGVALPTTVAGAAVVGGVAGVGTVALVDAALEPCRGFAAMFNLSHGECVDGHYVGDAPSRPVRRHWRR